MIILEKVNLGDTKLEVPVGNIQGKIPGPTVVVTAGIDGDEYVGIQTAYNLIEYYSQNDFPGRLIVIPLLNILGFYAGQSKNPLDNKYPKHIFPGDVNGSPSEKLIAWLNQNYLQQASLWIDLHGGADSEILNPFIQASETSNKKVNQQTLSLLSVSKGPLKIYGKKSSLIQSEKMSRRDCSYLLFECGQKGEVNIKDIQKMTTWVKQTLNVFWSPKPQQKEMVYLRNVHEYTHSQVGLWTPLFSSFQIKKGDILGQVISLDKKHTWTVQAKESGVILWAKSALFVMKGDTLVAVAT